MLLFHQDQARSRIQFPVSTVRNLSCWVYFRVLVSIYVIPSMFLILANDKNKRNKFYTTFLWLHAIIFKWKENKSGNLIYTVRGDKT